MYPTNKLHNKIKLLKVEDLVHQVNQEILTFVFNTNKKLPEKFESYFKLKKKNERIQNRKLGFRLIVPIPRSNYGEQAIIENVLLLRNNLPSSLPTLSSTKSFRS